MHLAKSDPPKSGATLAHVRVFAATFSRAQVIVRALALRVSLLVFAPRLARRHKVNVDAEARRTLCTKRFVPVVIAFAVWRNRHTQVSFALLAPTAPSPPRLSFTLYTSPPRLAFIYFFRICNWHTIDSYI